jgi:prepilin-type N-terminal cleavage/methylation domain-containing protein
MNTERHRTSGYTLVELLVVLAIIALLSGLAIPAVVKIGGFMGKNSDAAARDLYGVLRAARITAITNRRDTAVVYAVHSRLDNFTNVPSLIIDGYGMARRATPAQIAAITTNGSLSYDVDFTTALNTSSANVQADDIFVLAQDPQARFREMPNNTAVIGHLTAQEEQTLAASGFLDLPPQTPQDFYLGYGPALDPMSMYQGLSSRGMRMIYLFVESEDGVLAPVNVTDSNLMIQTFDASVTGGPVALENYAFPAHVFLPTGELGAPGSSLDRTLKERITIAVGASPDAPLEDRFTISPQEGVQAVMAAPVRIEVYRYTGRVVIAS